MMQARRVVGAALKRRDMTAPFSVIATQDDDALGHDAITQEAPHGDLKFARGPSQLRSVHFPMRGTSSERALAALGGSGALCRQHS